MEKYLILLIIIVIVYYVFQCCIQLEVEKNIKIKEGFVDTSDADLVKSIITLGQVAKDLQTSNGLKVPGVLDIKGALNADNNITTKGAINAISLSVGNGSISSGPITSGPITSTTLNTQGNPINCGTLTCTALSTQSNQITCGTLTCTALSTQGNTIACGKLNPSYIEASGPYNYISHNGTANICGLWSHRTGHIGGKLAGNGTPSWVSMGGMENDNGAPISQHGYNHPNSKRIFMWMIENGGGTHKALGLAINSVQEPNSVINTATQDTGFALMGYFQGSWRGGRVYSFTGEHSSMICYEEYNDIMNFNTDDFIGMVVCSTGKIYNLPYDSNGNTYKKQVNNIKPIDAQPMTRLCKKYKDKSVLGVISHIEKLGESRNDTGATCWAGTIPLDKDGRRRIRVACIGEGGIWITNEYGNIENGDYITTSKIAGYSTKQDDDLMHNYTIAKATMGRDFNIERTDDYKTKYLGHGIYASYIACTYHCG